MKAAELYEFLVRPRVSGTATLPDHAVSKAELDANVLPVVSQAEAEAGTATVASAWTALRVQQAIAKAVTTSATRIRSLVAMPAGSYIDSHTLNYAIDVNNPDMEQVNVLRSGSLFKTLWRNEWGAIRGTSPYTWGDAMIRALRDNGDGITTGQAIELGDRRTVKTNGSIMWGVRWKDGQMVQADQVVGAVFKTTAATSDAAILALNLPDGTLIVNV